MLVFLRSMRFGLLATAVFLSIVILQACAADQASTPEGVAGQPAEPKGLVADFQQTHGEILVQVRQGILPATVGAEAEALRIALEKYLIRAEAQLKILQLDVLHGPADARKAALEKIVALTAERERNKMAYLQRLQALKAGGKRTGEKTGKDWRVKELEIEIAPEDITEGEWP